MGYVRFDRAAINRKREVLEPLFLARRYESAIVLDGVSDRHSGHHIGDTEIRARHLFQRIELTASCYNPGRGWHCVSNS
mgnify:CR=1 FL=1